MMNTLMMAAAMIVAAEQAGTRYVVIDPAEKDGYAWEWKPSQDAAVGKWAASFGNPSEVKPRPDGKLLVAASGSGFACVDMRRRTPDFFGVVRAANLHSIELLPGGVVAAACSDGNCVALVDVKAHPLDPAKQRQNTYRLEQAHGVVWMPYRAPHLYAIGRRHVVEYRYDRENFKLEEKRRFDFTAAGCGEWGHDMMRDGEGRLVFTSHDAVGRLDLATGEIVKLEDRKAVKSHSIRDDGTILYCVPKEKWWTDTLLASDGAAVVRPGARFYKARWIDNNWRAKDARLPFADPFIHCENGLYYAYGTRSADGIAVATSKDLKTWRMNAGKARLGLALHKDDSYGEKWFWAPEVYRRADGRYVMAYSADQHVCAAVADSPLGPFVQPEKKPMLEDTRHASWAIDNSIFRDDDGRAWMFYVSGGINVVELEPDLLHVRKGAEPKYLFKAEQPWERHVAECWVNEGPFVLKHKGLYYLTYSGNAYENPRYGIGLATAKSVTGPWTKSAANPIMIRKAGLYGTGHHSFFSDAQGRLKIVFHAHPDGTWHEPRHAYVASASYVTKGGEKTIEIGDDVVTMTCADD